MGAADGGGLFRVAGVGAGGAERRPGEEGPSFAHPAEALASLHIALTDSLSHSRPLGNTVGGGGVRMVLSTRFPTSCESVVLSK